MGIFGRTKKSGDEEALIDKLTSVSEKPAKAGAESPRKGDAEAGIEKLGAEITALREVLQAQQERFERQSEEIGELRSMLAEAEKHINEVEEKAVKAAELVDDVQPENLMSEQRKADAKIEAIRGKIENSELISNSIIEEIKMLKNSVSAFRGTEEVIKLNKDVQAELRGIKKVEATVQKHADRVESMFSSFEANFDSFEKMKDDVSSIADSHAALKRDVEKNAVAIKDIPNKSEFYQIKTAVMKALDEIRNEKSIYDKRTASDEAAFSGISAKVGNIEDAIKAINQALSENTRNMDGILAAIEKITGLAMKTAVQQNVQSR